MPSLALTRIGKRGDLTYGYGMEHLQQDPTECIRLKRDPIRVFGSL